jgi:hypothetical protein
VAYGSGGAAGQAEETGVNDYWVCQHCKSINRGGSGRCYHCREKFGSEPKATSTIMRNSGAVQSSPPLTMPSRPEASPRRDEPPAYYSRAAAAAPPGPGEEMSFTEKYAAAAASAKTSRLGRLSPLRPIGRRVGQAVAARQTVSVSLLGYLTAGLLTLLLVVGVLLLASIVPTATDILQTSTPDGAWAAAQGSLQSSTVVFGAAFLGLALLSLIFFAGLVGLSTHNAPGLGAQAPLLTPHRGFSCWFGVVWAQVKIGLGLLVPALLFWSGYPLPGAIAAVIFLELGQHRLDDPFGWLNTPSRHLSDLLHKLATRGSGGSPVVAAWTACFRAANALLILACALPLIGLFVIAISTVAQRPEIRGWQGSGLGPAQVAVGLVAVALAISLAGTIALMVPVTIELVERQRSRRTLVRVGRTTPWVAHPAAGAHAPGAHAQSEIRRAVYDPYGPLDDDDQASLYSPSTTPSSPWSGPDEGSFR